MEQQLRIVVIGGVAAGPKAAARARRLAPNAEITVIERDEFLSYAGCGLPYYVSGVVETQNELMETPIGVVRDPAFFQKVKAIKVLNRTEATAIDREKKEVEVKHLGSGETRRIPYDKLIVATGAEPVEPPIPGGDLHNVFRLKSVHDAEELRGITSSACPRAAIVGGGLIGMEMTEAFCECGKYTTIIELLPQLLPMIDADMALLLTNHLKSLGVNVMTGTRVLRLEGDSKGNVQKVVTDNGDVEAEIVLLSIGIRPNVQLARDAGLLIGPSGGIYVNEYMHTSDPDILAAGDCAEKRCFVAGMPCFLPLGSVANKEGRVAGTNAAGGAERFSGVTSTVAVKVFDWNVARAGMTVQQAEQLGADVVQILVPSPDLAHYYPGAKPIYIKLVVERATRRLMGIQALGPGEAVKRVDVAVTAMTAGMTVDEIALLDLAYAPPYASAMDPLITAANAARNLLDGLYSSATAADVKAMMDGGDGLVLLDVRSPGEYEEVRIPGSTLIPLGALREKAEQLPREKPIAAFCKTSLRAYEAARYLQSVGFDNVRVMQGGVMAWPYEKETGKPQ
jgi:NADPH-dependent 2,4-dienoyl-CoA reductase/sulfur reductase-like enzyme/rhodanese-related sulfurtransferase